MAKEPEMLSQNQFVEQIVETYRGEQNRFCFILGAGASVESGVPSGTALEMRWMNCLMGEAEDYPAPKKKPEETRALAQRMYADGKITHPFDTLEQAWKKAVKNRSAIPSEYYFDIYSLRFFPKKENGYWYLERAMEGCRPSVGYHTLALLLTKNDLHNLVITTNFDSLVEDALFLYTKKKPMVAGHESLADYIGPNIRRPIVAKVHRSLFYEPINTPDNRLDPRWEDALQNFFASYTPVVIGYGGGDKSLMTFLEAKTTKMRHGLYWCCRNGEDPGRKVTKLVAEKGGHLVSIQGFDALMIEIGLALFREEILPASTADYFNGQSSDRMQAYNEQWDGWAKNNKTSNPELVSSMDRAETEQQETREKQDRLTARDYFRRGNRNTRHGNYTEAIDDYTKAIELDPDYEIAYNNRGFAFDNLAQYGKAVEDYTKAIELKPDYANAYNNRGYAYRKLGQCDRAVEDYTKAIELDPDFVAAFNNRGGAFIILGQYDKAVEDYTKAIELKPDYANAYSNRGYAFRLLRQYDKAIEDFMKAIELDPAYPNPYRHRGNIYKIFGQYDDAIADYSKAIELKPDYADAYVDRGYAYRKLGQYDKAMEDYNKAIELHNRAAQQPGGRLSSDDLEDVKQALKELEAEQESEQQ